MRPKVNDFSKSFALEKKFKPNPCKKSSKRHDCNDFKSTYCLKCSYSTRGLAHNGFLLIIILLPIYVNCCFNFLKITLIRIYNTLLQDNISILSCFTCCNNTVCIFRSLIVCKAFHKFNWRAWFLLI